MNETCQGGKAARGGIEETEHNRVQRLLTWEYLEFYETVLVESPFAETTRNGRGLREVALALTPTKLIVGCDVLRPNPGFLCPPGVDPSVESFELVSLYPLDLVRISVFRRRRKKTLKTRLVDGRTRYFELGGIERRNVYWKIWREEIEKLKNRYYSNSSRSETSAASSTSTTTTFYLVSSDTELDLRVKRNVMKRYRIWAHCGGGDTALPKWPLKDVYLGPTYTQLQNGNYTPLPIRFAGGSLEEIQENLKERPVVKKMQSQANRSWPFPTNSQRRSKSELCDVLYLKKNFKKRATCKCPGCVSKLQVTWPESYDDLESSVGSFRRTCSEQTQAPKAKRRRVQRGLAVRVSRFGSGVPEKCTSCLCFAKNKFDLREMAELAVRVWENGGEVKEKGAFRLSRHSRGYGFIGSPHFFCALGPWPVQPGERCSVQGRSSSAVAIRRQPVEPELRLGVSKRQLTGSISCSDLTPGKTRSSDSSSKTTKVILFWTPDYWYRPRAAAIVYREMRQHLESIQNFHSRENASGKRRFFHLSQSYSRGTLEKSSSLLIKLFSRSKSKQRIPKEPNSKGGKCHLRKLMRMELRVTAWDFDSTTLANQLTLIDRDLFFRIPGTEIETLVYQKSSRNAPNFSAFVAYSHRIYCLISTEILAVKDLKMRARIVSRFISAAKKCFDAGNFHSCRSILAGMQAPPIYRLRNTWSYLRRFHSGKYETFERLCKIFRNPSGRIYEKIWFKAELSPPCLPYVGHLVSKILSSDLESETCCKKARKFSKANRSCVGRVMNLQDPVKSEVKETGLKAFFGTFKRKERKLQVCSIGRERELARKFTNRWRAHVLESRILCMEEEKMKNLGVKRRRVLQVASWLNDRQNSVRLYNYPIHSLSQEFLLKARYREDRENFPISLRLEP
ncbi:uncharacterized protein [Prorops nasuta]|uniref:uncharacterized protein n=1 Tax=Prorops nasuta TaxID=863751 RepID=UPI0034CFC40D